VATGPHRPDRLTAFTRLTKEAVGEFLHSCRNTKGKFVAVDCTAVPEQLLESELFGCTQRAFTNAVNHDGLLSEAADRTVFLDR
jgi:Transcriptional regulator containing PAS, AAA-type ATPase, and DNA-binding domains